MSVARIKRKQGKINPVLAPRLGNENRALLVLAALLIRSSAVTTKTTVYGRLRESRRWPEVPRVRIAGFTALRDKVRGLFRIRSPDAFALQPLQAPAHQPAPTER